GLRPPRRHRPARRPRGLRDEPQAAPAHRAGPDREVEPLRRPYRCRDTALPGPALPSRAGEERGHGQSRGPAEERLTRGGRGVPGGALGGDGRDRAGGGANGREAELPRGLEACDREAPGAQAKQLEAPSNDEQPAVFDQPHARDAEGWLLAPGAAQLGARQEGALPRAAPVDLGGLPKLRAALEGERGAGEQRDEGWRREGILEAQAPTALEPAGGPGPPAPARRGPWRGRSEPMNWASIQTRPGRPRDRASHDGPTHRQDTVPVREWCPPEARVAASHRSPASPPRRASRHHPWCPHARRATQGTRGLG